MVTQVRQPGIVNRLSGRSVDIGVALFVGFIGLVVIYPIVALGVRAAGHVSATISEIALLPDLGPILSNTLLLGLSTLAVALVLGIGLAFCAARLQGRLYGIAVLLCVLPIILPPIAAVTGWVFIFAPSIGYGNVVLRWLTGSTAPTGPVNIYSIQWIIWITSLYLIGYVFVFVNTALRGINPAIESAARLAGAGWWRANLGIVLPAILPAIFYGAAIALLIGLGQFAVPLLLGSARGIDVVTTLMFKEVVSFPPRYETASILAMPLAALAIGVVVIQRYVIGSLDRYADNGSKGASGHHGESKLFFLGPLLYGFVATVPPVIGLVIVSLSPFWTATVSVSNFTLRHFETVLSSQKFVSSIIGTLQLATISTFVGLAFSVAIALAIVRKPSATTRFLDLVANLPVAVPGIVLGLGILLSYGLGPLGLYGSKTVFVIAWCVLYLPFSLRLAVSGLSQLPPGMERAARIGGAGTVRAFFDITLPLLRNTIASAGILLFILMSHEFSAAAMLQTSSNQVMATRLFDVWEVGTYPEVAALAIIMVLTSVAGVLVLLLVRGQQAALGR